MSTTNIAMTLSFTSGHLKLLGQENRTFTVASNTASVTLVPGQDVTFTNSITPSVYNSPSSVTISPSPVGLSSGQYIFTVYDSVAAGSTQSGGFGMSLTVFNQFSYITDPTMIFNPPG